MNKLSRFDKRGTAVHELGHALRLTHSGNVKPWCRDSDIYYTFYDRNPNTPLAHDNKQDYRELWGDGRRAGARDRTVRHAAPLRLRCQGQKEAG